MKIKPFDHLALFFLRVGIALAFFYAAIAAFLNPLSWIGFFPDWLTSFIPGTTLLVLWNIYEIILALWLLSGWKSFFSGLVASASLLLIIIPNLGAFDIVFRDIAILFAAVALTLLSHKNHSGD